jgi:hypothetical protein
MEVPDLLRRILKLDPDKIIVIKASVYDLVQRPLAEAGLPAWRRESRSPEAGNSGDSRSPSDGRLDRGRAAATRPAKRFS